MAKNGKGGPVERLAALRQEIVEVQQEIRRIESACIPFDEAAARIPVLVDALADRWRPAVSELASPVMPSVNVVFPVGTTDAWTVTGILATTARQGFEDALRTALAAHYGGMEPATCVPLSERPQRLAALRERLFRLECDEERLICDGAVHGVLLDRRSDASCAAIFAVVDDAAGA